MPEIATNWLELLLWYMGFFIAPILMGLAAKYGDRRLNVDEDKSDERRLNSKRVLGGHIYREKLWNLKGKGTAIRQKLKNLLAHNKTSDPSAIIDIMDDVDEMLEEFTSMMFMKDPDDD